MLEMLALDLNIARFKQRVGDFNIKENFYESVLNMIFSLSYQIPCRMYNTEKYLTRCNERTELL